MLYLAAPKGLFPPEPEHYRGPKLKVAIIGAGLAGMSTAVELLDQGHEVWTTLLPTSPGIMASSSFLTQRLEKPQNPKREMLKELCFCAKIFLMFFLVNIFFQQCR